eukprot:550270-Amorphochlora_amoeboformis.AAC.2
MRSLIIEETREHQVSPANESCFLLQANICSRAIVEFFSIVVKNHRKLLRVSEDGNHQTHRGGGGGTA